ncbi:MAG TPA: hypothetical protein PLR25_14285 [Planctomycetaceae bacterium]|nr:hypothetical protein [Planctomycetaceae bacterium]
MIFRVFAAAGLPSEVLASFMYSAMNSDSNDDGRCSTSPAAHGKTTGIVKGWSYHTAIRRLTSTI